MMTPAEYCDLDRFPFTTRPGLSLAQQQELDQRAFADILDRGGPRSEKERRVYAELEEKIEGRAAHEHEAAGAAPERRQTATAGRTALAADPVGCLRGCFLPDGSLQVVVPPTHPRYGELCAKLAKVLHERALTEG